MLITFNNYEPAGPLAYLITNKEGEMQLGLYIKKDENQLVFILNTRKEFYVLQPSHETIESFFRNEKIVAELAYDPKHQNVTNLNDEFLLENEVREVYQYLLTYMPGTLFQQPFFIVYPNCYYLYREFVDNFKIN